VRRIILEEAKSVESFEPARFETGRPMLLGGLRCRHDFELAPSGIAKQWEQFKVLEEVPGRVGSNLYGVMCGHDSTGLEYMCGVEVESFAALPVGTGRMRVPAQFYAVFAHDCHVSTLRSTWEQILEWLSRGEYGSSQTPDFELYGPQSDPLTGVGGVEIWVGVVPRR
jgi:AraC family transcriptional regulator